MAMSDYGRQTGSRSLEFERTFAAPIEKVWEYLVDPEKRAVWFCGGSTSSEVGGAIVFDFDHRRLSESAPPEKYRSEETATHRGEILAFEPPHRLAFTWFEASGGEPSEVAITLTAIDERTTRLRLTHNAITGRDMMVGVLAGWHGHFDILAEVLIGPRKSDFWIIDQRLEAEYEKRVPAI
jgi:uncharacterized protein YndB with AHSA1/START domain